MPKTAWNIFTGITLLTKGTVSTPVFTSDLAVADDRCGVIKNLDDESKIRTLWRGSRHPGCWFTCGTFLAGLSIFSAGPCRRPLTVASAGPSGSAAAPTR